MSELQERMIRDLRLAGLDEATQRVYLRSVRQLAAYYMVSPDQLSERQVQETAPGVRFTAIRPGHGVIESKPFVDLGLRGVVDHRSVVRIPHRN